MASDLQPLPLLRENESPTILSASVSNRIIDRINTLWRIQGTNGVKVTKSRKDVVIYVPPSSPTDVCVPATLAFDYNRFKRWIVIRGHVDLIGPGFNDIYPTGLTYVDMAGTSAPTNGHLRTRSNIGIIAGNQYTLTWMLAGNHRGPNGIDSVQALMRDTSSGAILMNQSHSLGYSDPWTTYTYTFTAASTTNISIEFINDSTNYNSVVGMLLTGITFTDDTNGRTLLSDEFECTSQEDFTTELNGPVFDILVYRHFPDFYLATHPYNRWAADAVYIVGRFGELGGVTYYNIGKLVPFQGHTTADWSFTGTVDFDSPIPDLCYVARKGDAVFALTGPPVLGETKYPAGYDKPTGGPGDNSYMNGGNFLSANTDGTIELIQGGDVPDLGWPIAMYRNVYDTSYNGGLLVRNNPYYQIHRNANIVYDTPKTNFFIQLATGYNRVATVGKFSGVSNLVNDFSGKEDGISVFSFNNLGDLPAGGSGIVGQYAYANETEEFRATGVCAVEGWDAFHNTVDRVGWVGETLVLTVLEAGVPNTGFAVTSRRGVDYWRPNRGGVLGETWYDYDETNPPTRGICLTDWRLMAGQVMTPSRGNNSLPAEPFPTINFPFWTGDGADCSCYSPIFTGWRASGNGEAIYCANNVVIDGGSTTWNGARANDFRGIYKLNLDGTAASPFAVHLTFTGVDPNTNLADSFFNHATLLLADPAGLIWFTGPVTSINGRTVQPWQLYKIASDGSGGTQVGSFAGGIGQNICSMKYFGAEQYIVGGWFTTYIDGNGNNTGANYLLFMDGTGSQISLTW